MVTTHKLRHETKYSYDRAVKLGPQQVALVPMSQYADQLVSQTLTINPEPSDLSWQSDGDIRTALVSFNEPQTNWSIVNTLVLRDVETETIPLELRLDEYAQNFPFAYRNEDARTLTALRILPDADPELIEILQSLPHDQVPTIEALDQVINRVALRDCSPVAKTKLLVKTLRAIKLAARFATGYDLSNKGALSVWCQTYLPGAGWVDLDANSGLLSGNQRLVVKVAASFEGARPVSGAFEPSKVDVKSSVSYEEIRLDDPKQITTPSSTHSKAEIQSKSEALARAGDTVDRLLSEANLKVSTFVETSFQEKPSKVRRKAWQDVVYDLRDRLNASDGLSSRLHNIHKVEVLNDNGEDSSAEDLVQRARFFTLAFPSLSRLIGKERFDGRHLKAIEEAVTTDVGGADATTFMMRHDQNQPFPSLSNALIERAILARLATQRGRFTPASERQLNDLYRLPSALQQDLAECCRWLSNEELSVDPAWYDNHIDEQYPKLWSQNIEGVELSIRPAYRDAVEEHRLSWIEIALNDDKKDRFDVAVNGWMLPLRRLGHNKISGLKLPFLKGEIDLHLCDKWSRAKIWSAKLDIGEGPEASLSKTPAEERRLIAPPANPDLLYSLDLAWVQYWGGALITRL